MTVDDKETTEEAESNHDDEMNSLKYEIRNHRMSVRMRSQISYQLVSIQEVLSPILTQPG